MGGRQTECQGLSPAAWIVCQGFSTLSQFTQMTNLLQRWPFTKHQLCAEPVGFDFRLPSPVCPYGIFFSSSYICIQLYGCAPPCASMCLLLTTVLFGCLLFFSLLSGGTHCISYIWTGLYVLSITVSCGRGWRSFRRSCWTMCMQSRWKLCRTWSSVLASSSRPPCRLL